MQQPRLAYHSRRERRRQLESYIEGGPIPDDHVYGGIDPPQGPEPTQRETIQGLGWMFDQDEDIIVAVRSRVPACHRAEEIDPLRPDGLDESSDDLSEEGFACRQGAF